MKTLTECVNQLKKNLQGLSGTVILIESYEGLDVPLMEDDDSKLARLFSETLQNNFGVDKTSFNNPYSKRALQAAWNIAEILSIALTYTRKESNSDISRGLLGEGVGKKLNGVLLLDSINYIDSKNMLPTPYIIDDVTNSINVYLIDFINDARKTSDGSSLFKQLTQLCEMISPQPISIDEDIINTATQRIDAYKRYQNNIALSLELSDDEDAFFDTCSDDPNLITDDELKFYDTACHCYDELFKERARNKLKILDLTIELSLNIDKQQTIHNAARSKDEEKYTFLLNHLNHVKQFIMDPKNDLKSICEHILNDRPLKTAFQELPDTSNQIVRTFEYLKKCLNDLLELCGFGRPFVERKRHGLTLFDTYKKQITDTLDSTDKTECSYQLETRI